MSWDSYIDNILARSKSADGTDNADQAGIFSLDGGSPWTTAHGALGVVLSTAEGASISKCMKSKDFTDMTTNGVYINGKKYRFLRKDDDGKLVLAKLKDCGSYTIQSTKTAIIIAHTKEGCQQGKVNDGVSHVCEYLEGQGM